MESRTSAAEPSEHSATVKAGPAPLSRWFLFAAIALSGALADLATKSWIFAWLGMPGESPTHWFWADVVGLQTSLNEGALFGMGQGKVLIFSILSLAALVGIVVWLFGMGAARDRLLTGALGLVSAGIIGNLYDRLGVPGLRWNYANAAHAIGDPVYAVRDFILVMIGRWPWPTFNLADSMLVCGAALLIWHAYRSEKAQRQTAG